MELKNNPDFARPEGLSDAGNLAYATIMAEFAKRDRIGTGGCKVFYSPQEWAERDETYGQDSELIVVYDGGDVGEYFALDKASPDYKLHDQMGQALRSVRQYSQEGTGWQCAIYKNNTFEPVVAMSFQLTLIDSEGQILYQELFQSHPQWHSLDAIFGYAKLVQKQFPSAVHFNLSIAL